MTSLPSTISAWASNAALTPRADLAKALLAEAMARNVLLLSCGTYGQAVRIIPPLVTTDDEVDLAVAAIGDSLASIGASTHWRVL